MALRMSLYNIAQPVGAMLSGAMQGALSTNLDGTLGRSGWRWAFIINVSNTGWYLTIQTPSNLTGCLHYFHCSPCICSITRICKNRPPPKSATHVNELALADRIQIAGPSKPPGQVLSETPRYWYVQS